MTNKQTFLADNLSFLSTQRGLSLIALAENTGIDPSTAVSYTHLTLPTT